MSLKTFFTKAVFIVKQISIEPFMFFLMFGYFVKMTTFQDLLINRSCRVELNYPDDVCDHLSDQGNEEAKARSMTFGVNMNTGCLMITTIPALIVSTFLGPWSDTYGRKYAIALSSMGSVIDAALGTVFALSKDMSPFYFLVSSFIGGLGGGVIVSISCVYSYMSHATDEKTRPTRFAILEFFFIMATPLGTIIGGKVFQSGSHGAVMALGAGSIGIAFLWLMFMVKEENEKRKGKTKRDIIRDLFKIDNMVKSYQTAVMPRQGNVRLQIWLLIMVSVVIRMITIGPASVMYYYVNFVFKWDVTQFADATTPFHFLNAITTIAVVPIFNLKLLLHEAAIGLVGSFSLMAKSVVLAVAVKPELIYFGLFCGLLSSCEGISIRSRMSKLVSKTELGRIFSLIATSEALAPVLGTLIMSQLFNAAKMTYPGLPFAVTALSIIPVSGVFIWMMRMPTTSFGSYVEMENITPELESVSQSKMETASKRDSQVFKEVPLNEKTSEEKF